MVRSDCPAAEKLDRLASGQVEELEFLALGQHLSGCRRCLSRLEKAPAHDPLIEAVQTSVAMWNHDDPAAAQISARVLQMTYTYHPADSDNQADGEDTTSPTPTEKLGPYRLVRLLGAGGMGTVFEAVDTRLDRRVALKVLQDQYLASPGLRKLFLDEAKALAALPHDRIVPIWDVGEENRFLYLAMPLLEGETLADQLQRERKLPWLQVADLGRQIAEALAFAHGQGFVHRDIKPGNLWLGPGDGARVKVVVLDFGLSQRIDAESAATSGAGTPAYMAPEQALGHPCASSDLYSLGCVLFRAGTGELPFRQTDPYARLLATAMDQAPSVGEIAKDCPKPLANLINQLLARNPNDRPPSAQWVLDALDSLQAQRRQNQRKVRAGILVAAGLILTVLGLWFGPGLQRFLTQNGEIFIQSDDPDVEIAVTKNGEQIAILDARTKSRHLVRAGVYDLNVLNADSQIQLSATKLTVRRGENAIVTVRYVPFPTGAIQTRESLGAEVQALAIDGRGLQMIFGTGGKLESGKLDPDAGASLCLESLTGEEKPRKLLGLESQVRAVAMSADGTLAAAADRKGRVALWEISQQQPIAWLQVNGPAALALAFSRDAQTLVAGCEDGQLRTWNRMGKLTRSINLGQYLIRSVAVLAKGSLALVGVEGGVQLWDYAAGEKVRDYALSKDRTLSLALDPQGDRFLAGMADGSVWLCTWNGDRMPLESAPDWSRKPWAVAFSHNGKLAAYSVQNRIRIWDIEGRRLAYEFEDHTAVVRALVSLPDNRRWISAGWDETIRLWASPPMHSRANSTPAK